MRAQLRLAAAGAALAALLTPALGLGASTAPTLKQTSDSGFPDKVYSLQLPKKTTLKGLSVTENGEPVVGLGVEAPGSANAAILLIDASQSMSGAPIKGAMSEPATAPPAERSWMNALIFG